MTTRDDQAIAVIREFAPMIGEPLHVAFSGGKDSVILLDLVRRSGVPHAARYNVTGIDPPELTRFIRAQYPDVVWTPPKRPFFTAMMSKGYPSRRNRWCCHELKEERTGNSSMVATGVRAAESAKRSRRQVIEACLRRPGVRYLNPILGWSDDDVWSYIRGRGLPYCSLYDEGWKRIGCVLCPQASDKTRALQAERWPRFVAAYRAAFRRLWTKRMASPRRGKSWEMFRDGDELFEWWLWFKPPASRVAEDAAAEEAEEAADADGTGQMRLFLDDDV